MHVVTSKTSHMFVTSAHDQTKISAKHHLPLRQNDFPSQRLPFSPWHHTAPNRWQSPRICHLHAKVAHDILLHRGDIRLRNKILLLCSSPSARPPARPSARPPARPWKAVAAHFSSGGRRCGENIGAFILATTKCSFNCIVD